MENNRERLLRYLNDAWTVEKGLVQGLRDKAGKANDPQVEALFQEHAEMTHQQEEMLEERIRALGGEPTKTMGFLSQMMNKIADVLHQPDVMDEDTQLLMKAYAVEHFESAMYESLAAFCEAIQDTETAALARRIQAQEQQTAQRLWARIPQAAIQPVTASGGGPGRDFR